MIIISICVTIFCCLAVHLGLAQAVAGVLARIAGCAQCATFWSVLAALFYCGCGIELAAMTAVVMAYIVNWLGFALEFAQDKYDELWERRRKSRRRRR